MDPPSQTLKYCYQLDIRMYVNIKGVAGVNIIEVKLTSSSTHSYSLHHRSHPGEK
jgi:hypothetical protein